LSLAATLRGDEFSLDDRYLNETGTIYLSGLQALVRMLLDRARLDRRNGRAGATP